MSLSKDESRAVGFVLLLLLLAGAGRLVLRPPAPIPDLPSVNLASLEKQSQAALDRTRRAAMPLRPREKLNVNAAPSDELERLPAIGPTLSRAIIGAREKDGPFATVADLAAVPGLSATRVEKLLPHITFGPSHGLPVRTHSQGGAPAESVRPAQSPRALVNPNEASLAELQALPGIGPALAARIVAFRGKSGPFHSPDDLLEVSGIGPAKLARMKPFLRIP